jgi:hypothetical protein
MDVWVRGTPGAKTRTVDALPSDAGTWTEDDVRRLLAEMLLAIDREKNPGGESPPVSLRGFSWIVSPYERGGVILHLEMQSGTASAGPIAIDEQRLTGLVTRVMAGPSHTGTVH